MTTPCVIDRQLAKNVDAFRLRHGSLERRECRISEINWFGVVQRDSSQDTRHSFNIGKFSERERGLNPQPRARPVAQDAPDRGPDSGAFIRGKVANAERLDHVCADLWQLLNVDNHLQQERQDTRV